MRAMLIAALSLGPCAPALADEVRGPRLDMERARSAFAATFPELCQGALELDQFEPEAHEIVFPPAYEDGPRRRVVLYGFPCNRGAYNVTSVWLIERDHGGVVPITFAVPEGDLTYADDAETRVSTYTIVGFATRLELINASFDPKTLEMTDHSKWRGLGDAFSAGSWTLKWTGFVLTRYTLDPTMNGEIDPFVAYEAPEEARKPVLLD